MDNDFFLDAGIPPLPHFDQPPMPTWHSLPPADVRFPAPATADGSSGCFFDSALSSMVSSPGSGSNSAISNEGIVLRELIGKLGNICNSGEISPPEHAPAPLPGVSPPYVSANNSCYNTPLSSPPKAGFFAHPVNSIGSSLPAMPGDSGFAERAARFSSFGSRSFNCRTTQFGLPNGSGSPSNAPTQQKPGRKLQRVSSSPALKVENENEVKVNRFAGNCGVDQGEFRDNSSIPEQPHPDAENGPRPGNDAGSASRKRKYTPKGKSKQIPSSPAQSTQNGNDPSAKRIKSTQEKEGNNTANEKPPEPPKDYIHVRARRGQATDSHSLAERLRREKISERMKLLQDIVPGCNKVTGKALMLEEIINYVQSLQRQVEFLSMKLASTPPSLDFSTSNSFHNDRFQPNCSLQTSSMHQLDTLSQNFYGAQNALQPNCIAENEVGPLNESHDMTLPPNDGFINGVHELQSLCEGDLHKIVEMGISDCSLYTG